MYLGHVADVGGSYRSFRRGRKPRSWKRRKNHNMGPPDVFCNSKLYNSRTERSSGRRGMSVVSSTLLEYLGSALSLSKIAPRKVCLCVSVFSHSVVFIFDILLSSVGWKFRAVRYRRKTPVAAPQQKGSVETSTKHCTAVKC